VTAKIFNLSLHRSGTQSFRAFMHWHGFRTAHWPGWSFDARSGPAVARLETGAVWASLNGLLSQSDVFCDLPYAFLYREALAAYPDAKFLLILRDVGRWIASVRRHIGSRPLANYEKFQYWDNSDLRLDAIADYSDRDLESIYLAHLAKLTAAMLEKRAWFKIFWLDDRELGRHCADYLGFEKLHEFPSIDYSRSNAPPAPAAQSPGVDETRH
jgi:Sulfotransferase domain